MDSLWIRAYACVAVFVLVQMGLFILQNIEHRRFARSRRNGPPPDGRCPRTALIAPCKGIDVGLEDNLRPLFEQDHPDFLLRLVIEDEADPAGDVIRELIAAHPQVEAELIVAGVSRDSGQKVHNLLAATSELPAGVEALAFVDSDARPAVDWLRHLTSRLDRSGAAAVTGYRWFVPTRSSLASCFLYSFNCTVAMLFGPGGHHLVWGGSWAIRRKAFDGLRIRDAWRGTLSDDLVVSRVLRAARAPIEFEPNCVVASPIDMDWDRVFEFVRRQFVIGKFYVPLWWCGAMAVMTSAVIAFWGGLALLAIGVVTGASWSWIPAVTVSLLYNGHVARGLLRHETGRRYVPGATRQLREAQLVDIWLAPLAGLACWTAMVSSILGWRITWRGIRYTLRPGGRVLRVERLGGGAAARASSRRVATSVDMEDQDETPPEDTPPRRPHFARQRRAVREAENLVVEATPAERSR